ncbi:MAG: hypothetical protein ACT4R6_13185 [Gemmatimonadaceae bacterium]
MQQSKTLALAFLLGAVLVGGVLGFAADRVMLRERKGERPHLLDLLDRRLELSDRQRGQIDAILDERQRQFAIAYRTIKPKYDSIRLNAREQMRQVLTPDQRAQFEALIAELNDSSRRDGDKGRR